MPHLPTLHQKLANLIILNMNASGLSCNEKLNILLHVSSQIVGNLSPDERRQFEAENDATLKAASFKAYGVR
jgi:hypothetical protein